MRFKLLFILIVLYYISSCSNDNRTAGYSPFIFASDTISRKLKFAESMFSIPSPGQTLLYLKKCNVGFNETLILHPSNIGETANTTARRSLLAGVLGADLSLLNLYDQKDLAYKDLDKLRKLLDDLEISQSIDKSTLQRMERNFTDNDSIFRLLSQIYVNSDQYLKDNDRRDVCALIVAGGWIESFYCLTQLYAKTKKSEIFDLITYQGEIIDNLIKMLSPYYEKSIEYSGLIDDLVNLAYEFDVLDYYPSVSSVSTDSTHEMTIIHNKMDIQVTGSKMDKLALYAKNLRNKIIQ